MSKGCIVEIDKDITLANGRITQYMHQIACIYIAVPQQQWNNVYLGTAYKLEGGNVANYFFQDKELTRI